LTAANYGGAITSLTYDMAGRKTGMDDPDMGTWSYAYDALGNLTYQDDAKDQRSCLYYDALNRLKGKVYTTSASNCPSPDPGYSGYAVKYYYDAGGAGSANLIRPYHTHFFPWHLIVTNTFTRIR
jgi:YD repeat-containing protein